MPERKSKVSPKAARMRSFLSDDETDAALELVASTIAGVSRSARRSAAIRKSILMAAEQIKSRKGGA